MANPFFTTDNPALLQEEVGDLVIRPLERESVAFQVARTVVANEHTFRVPILTSDAEAVWAEEGDDLSVDQPTTGEVSTSFSKVGAVVRVSSELQQDSTPEAAEMVGLSIARNIARKIDRAFFGNLAAPAPAGLGSLSTVQVLNLGAVTNLDAFTRAAFMSAAESGEITSWCINPGDAVLLAALKEESGSNRALLQPDPTQPNRLVIGGVALVPSPDVPLGQVWGIPQALVIVAIRKDVTVSVSEERFFETDELAVKAVARVGFLFPAPQAIVRLNVTGGSPIGGDAS